MRWYILLVRQGFEHYICDKLLSKKEDLDFQEAYTTEDLSGYVFIRSTMISLQQSSHFLAFDGTIKFLGTNKNSIRNFTSSQIKKMNVSDVELKSVKTTKYKVGDHVIIKNGDLSDISGEIVKIEIRKGIVKIKPEYFQKIVKSRIQDIEHL